MWHVLCHKSLLSPTHVDRKYYRCKFFATFYGLYCINLRNFGDNLILYLLPESHLLLRIPGTHKNFINLYGWSRDVYKIKILVFCLSQKYVILFNVFFLQCFLLVFCSVSFSIFFIFPYFYLLSFVSIALPAIIPMALIKSSRRSFAGSTSNLNIILIWDRMKLSRLLDLETDLRLNSSDCSVSRNMRINLYKSSRCFIWRDINTILYTGDCDTFIDAYKEISLQHV